MGTWKHAEIRPPSHSDKQIFPSFARTPMVHSIGSVARSTSDQSGKCIELENGCKCEYNVEGFLVLHM
jgi:hypothetical protein